jgi:hypothetical protein
MKKTLFSLSIPYEDWFVIKQMGGGVGQEGPARSRPGVL